MSIVEAEYCRDIDFVPFAFTINDEGLPKIVEGWEKKVKVKKAKEIISDANIFATLSKIFSENPKLPYGDLETKIEVAYKALFNKVLADNMVKDIIKLSREKHWVIQEKKRAPYTLGKYND